MIDPIISVEGLSKRYLVGHQVEQDGGYHLLRDAMTRQLRNLGRSALDLFRGKDLVEGDTFEEFWALRDLSFEVKKGEVLGLIGKNGAGKSTLLKILSRITAPDHGRAILRGRVASLLEVGTGFHPELTGRENIFLNGAILGMTKHEIKSKFDEIVDFAGVERFLDTPVKRYSSGMYVRLAFSIAAHLEPEILIVDEVLSVGDAEFQKKSLGRMNELASQDGRTVLFVSHNMQAVQSLCDRALLMKGGRLAAIGEARDIVSQYVQEDHKITTVRTWDNSSAPGNQYLSLLGIAIKSPTTREETSSFSSIDDLYIDFSFSVTDIHHGLCVGFDLLDASGAIVFRSYQTDLDEREWPRLRLGTNNFRCTVPKGLLNGGEYTLSVRIGIHQVEWIVHLDELLEFHVSRDHGRSPLWKTLTEAQRPGAIAPILAWKILEPADVA